MVEKVRVAIATGEASKERWYLLTSLPPHRCSPGEMLRLFRSHWSIEKNLHHVKDRSWDEDRHTLRRPGLGEVFATLVNVSLNTLRLACVWLAFGLRLACVWKDGLLPECPCRCEPGPVPSARNRLSPGSSDMQPDFAIVLANGMGKGPAPWPWRGRRVSATRCLHFVCDFRESIAVTAYTWMSVAPACFDIVS